MDPEGNAQDEGYVIPSRTITGSPQQILEEIDDMMEALRTVREFVAKRAPKAACPAERGWRTRLRWVLRFPLPPFGRAT